MISLWTYTYIIQDSIQSQTQYSQSQLLANDDSYYIWLIGDRSGDRSGLVREVIEYLSWNVEYIGNRVSGYFSAGIFYAVFLSQEC